MGRCNCDNANREYTDIKDLPTDDIQYAIGIGKDGNLKIGEMPDISGYLPLSGGTMTGPLTLSGDPIKDYQAATKKYVDDTMADFIKDPFNFQGYVSTADPTTVVLNVAVGSKWIESSSLPDKFPADVRTWSGKGWDSSAGYTPTDNDEWQNLNDNTAWFWLGGKWEQLDYGGAGLTPSQFEIVEGKLRIKQNAITDNEIAVGANIQQSKILNLGPELANLHGRVAALEKAPQGDGWTRVWDSTPDVVIGDFRLVALRDDSSVKLYNNTSKPLGHSRLFSVNGSSTYNRGVIEVGEYVEIVPSGNRGAFDIHGFMASDTGYVEVFLTRNFELSGLLRYKISQY